MIKSVLIGGQRDVEKYSRLLHQSKYYNSVDKIVVDEDDSKDPDQNILGEYDAVFLVSRVSRPVSLISDCIKRGINLYFTDQLGIETSDISKLEKLYNESVSIIFPEFKELNHPLVEDFISVETNQLRYSYKKSVSGKKEIRQSLITAVSFLSLLSAMPVKKIDVSTIETTINGRPTIKVRLKMYDSSVCNILLEVDNENIQTIEIESAKGNFHFNFTGNYLENSYSTKFFGEEIDEDGLLLRTLNSFAMNIILNTKPVFSFNHYLLVISLIHKIEIILKNSV